MLITIEHVGKIICIAGVYMDERGDWHNVAVLVRVIRYKYA
jgi:hypothetical protein